MTQKIILFNGPSRSGKDTAARACMEADNENFDSHYRVFDRMSMPIKRAFAAMMCKNIDRWGNVETYEAQKDTQWAAGPIQQSYRQWQIDFSEKFMKPLYGENVFGRLFVQRQISQHQNAVIFVPDCGFDTEHRTLSDAYLPHNVLVVKIYRPGTDYKGDSRNYLKVGSFGDKRDTEHVIHVNNAGTEAEFKAKIITRVAKWLEGIKQ